MVDRLPRAWDGGECVLQPAELRRSLVFIFIVYLWRGIGVFRPLPGPCGIVPATEFLPVVPR